MEPLLNLKTLRDTPEIPDLPLKDQIETDLVRGAICGFCMDLVAPYDIEIRPETEGRITIRWDWDHCGQLWSWSGLYDVPTMNGSLMSFIYRSRRLRGLDPVKSVKQQRPVRLVSKVPPGFSAIEASFTAAIQQMKPRELRGLISQYPVGRYRIDYAIPGIMFGIELDGFRSHSSTEDIANDRYRERQLQRAGWTIIRFGGLEIHRDVIQCVIEANELAGAQRARYRRRRW